MFGIGKMDRGLMLRFFAEGVSKAAAFLAMPLMLQLLGTEGYGQFTFSQAVIAAMVPLVSLGLGFSLIRQIAGLREKAVIKTYFSGAFLLISCAALPLAAAQYLSAPFLASLIGHAAGGPDIIRAASYLLPTAAWQGLAMEALRARQYTGIATLLQVTEATMFPAGILCLAQFDLLDVTNMIKLLCFLKFLVAITAIAAFSMRNHSEERITWLPPRHEIANALTIGLPFMVAGTAEWLMAMGDRFAVGAFYGAEATGHYAGAQVLAAVTALLGAPLWWILFPRFCAALEQQGPEAAAGTARGIGGFFIEWSLPLLVVLIFSGSELLRLLGGPVFRVESSMIACLALAVFINQAATPWEYALYATRHGSSLMRATLLWGVIAFVLSLAMLPTIGAIGAAIAVMAGRFGFAASVMIAAGKAGFGFSLLPEPSRLKRIAGSLTGGSLVAAVFVAAADSVVLPEPIIWPLTAALYACGYSLCALLQLRHGRKTTSDHQ